MGMQGQIQLLAVSKLSSRKDSVAVRILEAVLKKAMAFQTSSTCALLAASALCTGAGVHSRRLVIMPMCAKSSSPGDSCGGASRSFFCTGRAASANAMLAQAPAATEVHTWPCHVCNHAAYAVTAQPCHAIEHCYTMYTHTARWLSALLSARNYTP